ncbi:hypothetical protein M3Y96_00460500 [Aphelenchoides besseyi]|nr:hypothetical protein M3Y96_00460500 [Aphelenchoides besseyi]
MLLIQHSMTLYRLVLLFVFNSCVYSLEQFSCDILDQNCRDELNGNQQSKSRANFCNYQDLWLIPGRADASCTRPDSRRLVEIDPRQVTIRPPLIKFPGCFTIEIKNLRIQNDESVLSNSFFAKTEYQWLNVKQFGDLKCQNATTNGCGGYGNNCYYCDICESLQEINSSSTHSLASQFHGLHCPQRAGFYTFRKEFCFNDWSAFDHDGDCQLDFLQTDRSDLKGALASLQQIGYGTVIAKIRMAFNATNQIEKKRKLKETQITRAVEDELAERKQSWDIARGQFEKFRDWYVNYRKNTWHREEYLPWLLYENEISCLRLTFDVCERLPHRKAYGSRAMSERYGIHVDGKFRHFPAFLRLFRQEFDSMLDREKFHEKYKKAVKKYLPKWFERFDQRGFPNQPINWKWKNSYFLAICQIPMSKYKFWYWFQDQLYAHVQSGGDSWLCVMLEGKPEEEVDYKGKTVQHFDKLFPPEEPKLLDLTAQILEIQQFIHYLRLLNIPEYDDRVLDVNVIPTFERYKFDHNYAACEILRRMPYAQPGVVNNKKHSWFLDLLTVFDAEPRNRSILEMFTKEDRLAVDDYICYLKSNTTQLLTANFEDLVDPTLEFSMAFRPQRIIEEDEKIHLRGYQKELVRDANLGINTLICAPTGAGKTIVAADIILKHFERLNVAVEGIDRARVAFIVPSVPLVEQQTQLMARYINSTMKVTGFHGGDQRNANLRLAEFLHSHVTVITPQLLLNMMSSVYKNERVYVSDFTLIVFDECHHCGANNHPYQHLMQLVREYRKQSKNKPPQVVGLTASLGTGSSTYMDPNATEQHMLGLCVRMMAEQISTIHSAEALAELECYVNPPIDTIESVKRQTNDTYNEWLCECIRSVTQIARPFIQYAREHVEDLNEFRLTDNIDQTFINAVERLYESCTRWPQELIEYKRLVITIIDNLRIYLHAVRMNDILPAQFADSYMKSQMATFIDSLRQVEEHSDEEIETGKQLMDIFYERREHMEIEAKKDSGSNKEILRTLVRILDEEYTRNSNTRTMIFVEQRATTHSLSTFLSKSHTLSKHFDSNSVRALTSTNQSVKLGGMSNDQQKRVIQQFSSGCVKVLVVTSVAEEGMDISACNLIIKYNVVGSERTLIQRRGRARLLNSRSILLALDSHIEQREIENINRERMMHICLKNLQSKSVKQLRQMIHEKRVEVEREEEHKRREYEEKERTFNLRAYDVKCSKCDFILTQSNDLRVVNGTSYVSVNPNVWSRIKIDHQTARVRSQELTPDLVAKSALNP